ncbi:ABC transporter ATP-binding protein [Roseobacter cerasinus]|uniref:ABC transporter ATP-binding protein n=2 Tax=Roseobacter cerasinus TaxID=2602289 RepID=A0A640VTC2_9RHOB|nr:ABC transporter ATP-binding protein [Roseobacter cerasinus]
MSELSYSVSGTDILRDISVEIPARGMTALIGPNGAGKSTLLHLMSRQMEPMSGQVVIDGQDLATITAQARALKLAVVAQHLNIASRIRIRDLVGFGRWPHARNRPTAEDRAWVTDAMTHFDLIALQDRFLDEVSGGQRQRAFIAMAYAQDTEWLLLDEPLNNLDLHHARSLMARLRDMADHQGKSIVIVLHDLNYAISWADHVVALRAGRVAFEGPVQAMATGENLSNLYQTPVAMDHVDGRPFARYHR